MFSLVHSLVRWLKQTNKKQAEWLVNWQWHLLYILITFYFSGVVFILNSSYYKQFIFESVDQMLYLQFLPQNIG